MDETIHPAGLRPDLCSHAARVMTFKPKKQPSRASRWPHPPSFALTPEILASAGYFHDPADNESDRTTCWMCGESMKGWAEDDDPWDLHLKWSSNCPFARIALLEHQRSIKKPSWTDSPNHNWGPANEWFPRGAVLIESRLATFCGPDGPWKHEGKKGIPTRLELARAGFHFTPNLFKKGRKFDVDDTTSCCYCDRTITEWEVDDDPVSVHLKKGACIFFTANQPPEAPAKSGAKPTRKASKNLKSGPSNSLKASTVDLSIIELTSDMEATEKSSNNRKKKPASATSNVPKTGRRALASSTSSAATPDDLVAAESENFVQHKSIRASRKAAPTSNVLHSPESNEQATSKPPVTLAKTSRLSRSTSKAPATTTNNRPTTSNTTHRPRTRASSNASSTLDPLGRSTSNHTLEPSLLLRSDEEELVGRLKKSQRSKNPSKAHPPSSTVNSETEDYRPLKQLSRNQNGLPDEQELSTAASDDHSKPGEDVRNKIKRMPGKTKSQLSKTLRSEAHSPTAPYEVTSNSQINTTCYAESSTHPKVLTSTLFPGFNPQAPQLYPTLLPIAGKSTNPSSASLKGQVGAIKELVAPVSKRLTMEPSADVESESLLKEYLGQKPVPIPEGWLPNPYNPSRPFPPLTPEEARMPLNEYFAYRAKQEEEEFLKWVEEKQMKPWLEAVERGRKVVEAMIVVRKSQRTNSHRTLNSENRSTRQALIERNLNRANSRV